MKSEVDAQTAGGLGRNPAGINMPTGRRLEVSPDTRAGDGDCRVCDVVRPLRIGRWTRRPGAVQTGFREAGADVSKARLVSRDLGTDIAPVERSELRGLVDDPSSGKVVGVHAAGVSRAVSGSNGAVSTAATAERDEISQEMSEIEMEVEDLPEPPAPAVHPDAPVLVQSAAPVQHDTASAPSSS